MSGSDYTVRRLGAGDLATMRALNALFGDVFDDAENYASAPPPDAYLQAWLAKPHVIALVALSDGAVVGGLVAYVLDKFEQARSEIYIYDLAVADVWRRRRVATALIAALGDIAAAHDAWVIYVQADYGDDPAVALYTKLGAREDVMHFDIAMPKSRDPAKKV